MSGTSLPSSATCAFHALNDSSSSSSSWPRRSRRTGCAESGETRYWYHERSHATVTASSPFVPESGMRLAFASPRLFWMPPTVRRNVLPLNRSAASRIATSSFESRRRIGSDGTIVSSPRERLARAAPAACVDDGGGRRRRRASTACLPSASRARPRSPGRADRRRRAPRPPPARSGTTARPRATSARRSHRPAGCRSSSRARLDYSPVLYCLLHMCFTYQAWRR